MGKAHERRGRVSSCSLTASLPVAKVQVAAGIVFGALPAAPRRIALVRVRFVHVGPSLSSHSWSQLGRDIYASLYDGRLQ